MIIEPKTSRWFRRTSLIGTAAAALAVGASTAGIASGGTPRASPEHTTTPTPIALVDDRAQTMAQVHQINAWTAEQVRKRKVEKLKKVRQKRAARAARAEQRRELLSADPRDLARATLQRFGWGASQFGCLDALWRRESGWNRHAENPSSGAYGIPQALPASKMSSAGPDWRDNPITQIVWGLGYIRSSYGSPCGAWAHSQSRGWY